MRRDCITVGQASSATLILPCWGLRLSSRSCCCPAPAPGSSRRPVAVLLLGKRQPCMHEIVLIRSLKWSGFSPCKRFVMILMRALL